MEILRESIFDYLGRETRRLRRPPGDLPFDFDCGFAGYFGYELKADCDGERRPPLARSPTPPSSSPTAWSPSTASSAAPTSSAYEPDGWGRGAVDRGDEPAVGGAAAAPSEPVRAGRR